MHYQRYWAAVRAKPPNHFKRAGYIAYWLRRYRPVIKWEDQHKDKDLPPEAEKAREFLMITYMNILLLT